jgi:hypothetical protein
VSTQDISPKIRQAVLLTIGAAMLLFITYTGRVNTVLVLAALACLGVPTGLSAVKLWRTPPVVAVPHDPEPEAEGATSPGTSPSPPSDSSA